MEHSITRENNQITITLNELSEEDFNWAYDYFKAILELKLPLLLDSN